MVIGFESFREHFIGYDDCYTVIGGAACDVLMKQASLEFRATKDVDIILIVEDKFPEFAVVFWEYIKNGGYRCGWKNSPGIHFYRFTEPSNRGYPIMIELFSKQPDYNLPFEEMVITPLHIDDDISSLSAILLDDDYYNLMMKGRKIIDGVPILSAEYLIPFKAIAWLDLTRKKSSGENISSRDLKKHRNDIFRLYELVNPQVRVEVTGKIYQDITDFLDSMPQESLVLSDLGLDKSLDEVLVVLRQIYVKS
jgi:hypothetical protein